MYISKSKALRSLEPRDLFVFPKLIDHRRSFFYLNKLSTPVTLLKAPGNQ